MSAGRIGSRVLVAVLVALILMGLRAVTADAALEPPWDNDCDVADTACLAITERQDAIFDRLGLLGELAVLSENQGDTLQVLELGLLDGEGAAYLSSGGGGGGATEVVLTGDSQVAVEDTRHLLGWLVGIAGAAFFSVAFWRTFGRGSGA